MNKPLRYVVLASLITGLSAFSFASCADEVARQACSECSAELQEQCEEVISDCVSDDLLTTSECDALGQAVCD